MGTITRISINALVVLLAVAAGFYQLHLKPLLNTFGYSPTRIVQQLRNTKCKTIPELQACEKIVLHQPTGVIYLACSTQSSRKHWTPSFNLLNTTGASHEDYVATYDPATSQVTRLTTHDFNDGRGLSLYGMDVVPSTAHPEELFVYLVNHRVPLAGVAADTVGADSVIEIFKTAVGGKSLTHLKTVQDSAVITPNDIVGSDDGKSFYFTNDHGIRVGYTRYLDILGHRNASVGYCHLDEGCKFALKKTHSSNGIATAPNGTLYIGDSVYGGVTVLERQTDNTLVVTDSIATEYTVDNLAMDANGQLWVAAIPQAITASNFMLNTENILSPSSAMRISINTGPNAFYGEKYRVQKIFEDDGKLMSGITTAVYDSERRKLFMHGVASPQLVVCDV